MEALVVSQTVGRCVKAVYLTQGASARANGISKMAYGTFSPRFGTREALSDASGKAYLGQTKFLPVRIPVRKNAARGACAGSDLTPKGKSRSQLVTVPAAAEAQKSASSKKRAELYVGSEGASLIGAEEPKVTTGACSGIVVDVLLDSTSGAHRPTFCPILVRDGRVVVANVPPSASDFLQGYPSCPYTTTRTWGCQRKLLFWDSHMKRLAQSAQEMHRAGKWEKAPCDLTPAQLYHVIQPSLQVALAEAALHFQDVSMATPHELSVTVLLLPASSSISTNSKPPISQNSAESIEKNGSTEGRSAMVSKQQSARRNPSTLEVEALGGEDSIVDQKDTCNSGHAGTKGEMTACVYVSGYKAPEAGSIPSGTKVAVMGPGRQFPLAKDSSWALDRRPLETSKPPGVGEILLSNDGEALLEGMLTNFFAVRRVTEATNRAFWEGQQWTARGRERRETGRQGAGEGGKADGLQKVAADRSSNSLAEADLAVLSAMECECGSEVWKGLVVQTASLEEGVLPGVVRQEVLRLCKEWGVPIILSAPRLSERGSWVEAFVTSSVRIVQPVTGVRWRPGWRPAAGDAEQGHVSTCEWQEHELPADSPLCRRLWDALLDEERLGGSSLEIADLCNGTTTSGDY